MAEVRLCSSFLGLGPISFYRALLLIQRPHWIVEDFPGGVVERDRCGAAGGELVREIHESCDLLLGVQCG